jgi:hypothetical protein
MRYLKYVGYALLIALLGIQFIPTARNQSNEVLDTDFIKTFTPSGEIESLLRVSCYDCHSNNTDYPWYNKIQPVSWFMERHINEAKEELNFNEFGDYSGRKTKSKLKSIISQVDDDEMPLSSYTMIHRGARLSDDQKQMLIDWIEKIRDDL